MKEMLIYLRDTGIDVAMLDFVKNNFLSLGAFAAVLKVFPHNRAAAAMSKALGAFTGTFKRTKGENNGKNKV